MVHVLVIVRQRLAQNKHYSGMPG